MTHDDDRDASIRADDEKLLRAAGYRQELARRLGGFSNFAISFSVICILAGGLTSFHVGLCSVGGAAVGVGWPVACLFSLVVAATMAQVASAFPTAGGPYHWASILGGRGWGWATACFNLVGLLTVLAAINEGTVRFLAAALGADLSQMSPLWPHVVVVLMTASQAFFNHWGIRLTSRLTDLSGYLILVAALALTVALLTFGIAHHGIDLGRLTTFANYSGEAGGGVWPRNECLGCVFFLGLLLPAYTLTGFDASAHTAEETVGAAENVPRGIVRSVWVSGLAGFAMLAAIVLAIPDMDATAALGEQSFHHVMRTILPSTLSTVLYGGIVAAQYLCGLATLTSASRMTYAFARDGGLPAARLLSRVSPKRRSPSAAIWAAAVLTSTFAVAVPYEAVAAMCTVFLYISYVVPTALGLVAYGRTWTRVGPWHLGGWYRPLAAVGVVGCGLLLVIGVQPPNDIALWIVGGTLLGMAVLWFGLLRRRFAGPPRAILHLLKEQSDKGASC